MEFMYKDNYIYLNDKHQVIGYIYYQTYVEMISIT